jgi:hypothetical protein
VAAEGAQRHADVGVGDPREQVGRPQGALAADQPLAVLGEGLLELSGGAQLGGEVVVDRAGVGMGFPEHADGQLEGAAGMDLGLAEAAGGVVGERQLVVGVHQEPAGLRGIEGREQVERDLVLPHGLVEPAEPHQHRPPPVGELGPEAVVGVSFGVGLDVAQEVQAAGVFAHVVAAVPDQVHPGLEGLLGQPVGAGSEVGALEGLGGGVEAAHGHERHSALHVERDPQGRVLQAVRERGGLVQQRQRVVVASGMGERLRRGGAGAQVGDQGGRRCVRRRGNLRGEVVRAGAGGDPWQLLEQTPHPHHRVGVGVDEQVGGGLQRQPAGLEAADPAVEQLRGLVVSHVAGLAGVDPRGRPLGRVAVQPLPRLAGGRDGQRQPGGREMALGGVGPPRAPGLLDRRGRVRARVLVGRTRQPQPGEPGEPGGHRPGPHPDRAAAHDRVEELVHGAEARLGTRGEAAVQREPHGARDAAAPRGWTELSVGHAEGQRGDGVAGKGTLPEQGVPDCRGLPGPGGAA